MEEKYIKVLFKHSSFEEESFESAWVKKIGKEYLLDNLLFYAKEYSLGDSIIIKGIEGEFYANGVKKESGNSLIQILYSDSSIVEENRLKLKQMGYDSELSNFNKLIALNIPYSKKYIDIIEYLDKGEHKGLWEYQEASISLKHSI